LLFLFFLAFFFFYSQLRLRPLAWQARSSSFPSLPFRCNRLYTLFFFFPFLFSSILVFRPGGPSLARFFYGAFGRPKRLPLSFFRARDWIQSGPSPVLRLSFRRVFFSFLRPIVVQFHPLSPERGRPTGVCLFFPYSQFTELSPTSPPPSFLAGANLPAFLYSECGLRQSCIFSFLFFWFFCFLDDPPRGILPFFSLYVFFLPRCSTVWMFVSFYFPPLDFWNQSLGGPYSLSDPSRPCSSTAHFFSPADFPLSPWTFFLSS